MIVGRNGNFTNGCFSVTCYEINERKNDRLMIQGSWSAVDSMVADKSCVCLRVCLCIY